ncbi:MAG: type II toxin-antitoxin system ParD family antitoxin [Nanoarchaeota archaeon]
MKQKLSITIDEKKIKFIEKLLEEGRFRSKSHVLEYSLNKLLKEELKINSFNEVEND